MRRKVIFWIWLVMAVSYMDRVNITVAGPAISKSLHLDKAEFGGVLSAFSVGYALAQVPGGALADRLGARVLLSAALAAWSGFTALTGAVQSLGWLAAVRGLFGAGEGLENGAQFKLVGDHFEPKDRSAANGVFLSALAVGPAIAAPATSWLLVHVGWRALFVVFAGLGVALAVLIALFLPGSGPRPVRTDAALAWRVGLSERPLWFAAAAYLLFNIAFWGFVGWFPTYLAQVRGIDLAHLGLVASAPYAAGLAGILGLGYLGSRGMRRYRALLVAGAYLLAAASFVVAFRAAGAAESVAGLSLAAFFLYGGFGPFWAVALDAMPESARGTLSGFVNFAGQVGGFIAPVGVGWIAQRTGSFAGGFAYMEVALALSAAILVAAQVMSTAARAEP